MSSNICNICGANYEYVDGRWKCPACGAYKPEEISNEEVTLLYNAAQKLRLCAFDDAEGMYRDIVRKYPKNSAAYWGLVCAKYGIKYEEDYDGKMIPSCYAASYESVFDDKDYNRALEFATNENRKYYELQAQKIEAIRKEWVEKASQEPPYDIFISFKDTELDNGVDRTKDSHEAHELYTHLKGKGYRVFYSRESLKDKTGEIYEPYIFNALNTAQIMIVYGSKPEYLESTWIRNEWLRYYKRCKSGSKQLNSLVVVYHGFNPAKLPAPLPTLQHINREEEDWLRTLDDYIERVLKAARTNIPKLERTKAKAHTGKGTKKTAALKGLQVTKINGATASVKERETVYTREIGTYSVPKLNANAEKLLNIANAYLKSGNFDDAEKAFDEFLLNNSKHGGALFGKMLAQTKCCDLRQFQANGIKNFDDLQLLNDVLAYSEKEAAEEILAVICGEVERRFDAEEYAFAQELYAQICSVDFSGVKALREALYHKSLSLLNNGEVNYFIDTALLYEQEENDYIKKLHEVFKGFMAIGSFAVAEEYLKKLFACDETDLQTQTGKLQVKYKATNFSGVFDALEERKVFSDAEELLHNVDEDGAAKLLNMFADRCEENIKAGNFDCALGWFSLFSQYQFEQRESALQTDVKLCIQNPNEKAKELFESIAQALSNGDAEKYAEIYYNLAQSARGKALFTLAISCYDRAIEYGVDDLPDFVGKLYAEMKCDCATRLSECIVNLQSYETLENIIVLIEDDKSRIDFLSKLISACIVHVRNAHSVEEQAFIVFEKLLSYIPEAYDDKVLASINELARVCLGCGYFEQAERYFAMSAGINADDHTVYWGLLHAKLKCKNEEELIKQSEIISEFQEFRNALSASAMNDVAMQHYINVQNRQKAYLEEQEQKRKKAKKRKKVITIASIVLTGAVAISGAVTGIVHWYNSENQLKYEAVSGGYAIDSGIFYHNSVSGKFEIPLRYNNKPITEIKENAFENFDKVTEFVIPYTVTKIASNAFAECDNLQKISFAQRSARSTDVSDLTAIGTRAFYNCKSLNEFLIPYGVTTIGDEAFSGTAFTKLDIPNTVEYIGFNAFGDCAALETITVGDREEIPHAWNSAWNSGCAAEVVFSLRVRLAANGGTLDKTEQYVIYHKDFRLPVPTRTGYTFQGWFRDEDRLTDENGASLHIWNFADGGTVSAAWAANENKIVFNGNGATGGSMSEQTIKTNDSAPLSQNKFTRAGYTFAGWATSANGSVVYADKAAYKMGAESSYTLYAVWQANENKVVFNGNGATNGTMSAQSIKTDASATLNQNAFAKTGYRFIGWRTEKDGSVVYADKATYKMGAESSYTLYAVWEIVSYKITYHLGGGTASDNPDNYNIESNSFTLVNPTRAGYTFAGWAGTGISSATQTVTVEKGSTGDRTYIATWTANLNAITFHANGGEGEMAAQKIATDITAALSNNIFTRTGYDFIGWATSSSGAVVYVDGATYKMGTNSNYNLYAVWQIHNYTVAYNLNGGTVSGNPTQYNIESNTFTLVNPTRAGYTFAGWAGTGLSSATQTVTVSKDSTGDRTYTANWDKITYSITYELNGGTVSGNKADYDVETATFTLNNPTKTGYTFIGWSGTELTGNEKSVTITKGSLGNRNYEAHFEPTQYQIKYNLFGGTANDNPDAYTIETKSFTLNNPTRAGYTFAGWTGTGLAENTMTVTVENSSIGNREYTAVWQANLNVILFNGNDEDSGSVERITGYTDEWIRLPKSNYIKSNHEFKGWSATPNGEIVAYDRDLYQVGVNSSTTLYAVWQDWTGYTPISTAEELKNIQLDGKYYLTNDIDLNGEAWTPLGEIGSPICNSNYVAEAYTVKVGFSGIFNGNNHAVYNFKMRNVQVHNRFLTFAGGDYVSNHGYFGGFFVGVSGEVSNLNFYNISYNAINYSYESRDFNHSCCYFGGICGQLLEGGKIENCSVLCDFSAISPPSHSCSPFDIGGIVAVMEDQAALKRCYTNYSIAVDEPSGVEIEKYNSLLEWYKGSIIEYTDGTISYFDFLKNKEPTILILNEFNKVGYSFVGWSTKKNGTVEYAEGQEFYIDRLQKQVTLYPVWQPNNNTVVFNANSGNGVMDNQTIATDTTVALNEVSFTKEGYHFIGWATEQNGEVVYADGANFNMGTDSVYTLYAVWEPNENEIIFNATLGSGSMPNQKIRTDETVSLNGCTFTPPQGYYFAGWTEVENGTEVIYLDCAEITMTAGKTITLYAIWKEI